MARGIETRHVTVADSMARSGDDPRRKAVDRSRGRRDDSLIPRPRYRSNVLRSPLAAAAVALLLVVAGCGGNAPGDPTATSNGTPTAASGGDLADVSFPDGYSRTDIDTATARNRSVSVLRTEWISAVALERFRPGAYADYRYDANATRARFRFDVHNGYSDVTERDTYVEGSAEHSRHLRDGRLSFRVSNGSVVETRMRAADSLWAVASRILTVGEFRAVEASRVDGDRRIRYTATGVVARNATGIEGYLIVDGDGVIREARLSYTQAAEPKRFRYSVERRSGGVTPPAWLPAARADVDAGGDAGSEADVDADVVDEVRSGARRRPTPSPLRPAVRR